MVNCLLETCPAADEAPGCGETIYDGDSCADIEAHCTNMTAECCPTCSGETADVVICATGGADGLCADNVTCGDANKRFLEDVADPAEQRRELDLFEGGGGSCVSESIAAYTKCVINKCPAADNECGTLSGDGDTCADLGVICDFGAKCCPECQSELTALLTCSTGGECDVQCTKEDQAQDDSMESIDDSAPPTTTFALAVFGLLAAPLFVL